MVGVIFIIPPYDALCIRQCVLMEKRHLDALFQLFLIIHKAGSCLGEEEQDGGDVGENHESHEEVRQVPNQRQVRNGKS